MYLKKTTIQQTGEKRKKEKKGKVLSRTRTRHLLLDATIPYLYTTEAAYVTGGKSL